MTQYDVIYLQDDGDPKLYAEIEITWCSDRVNDDDTKYIRADKLSECRGERDGLAEVEAAARIIFDVTCAKHNEPCPHGINLSYPTHAWWCDECWIRLGAALASMQDE